MSYLDGINDVTTLGELKGFVRCAIRQQDSQINNMETELKSMRQAIDNMEEKHNQLAIDLAEILDDTDNKLRQRIIRLIQRLEWESER